jgi:hypothetical protein
LRQGHKILPSSDGAGRILHAKLRMQQRELFSYFLIFFRGTWALKSSIVATFKSLERCLGIFSTFAAIMTNRLTKHSCANQFILVLEQEKTGCKQETMQPALQKYSSCCGFGFRGIG